VTHLIERFTEILKKGKYNSNTITAYRNVIFVFYNHFRDYPQTKISDEVISDYITEIGNKHSNVEAMQVGKAVKLFFEVIFNRQLNLTASGKPKEEVQIDLFSPQELQILFENIKNPKHKLLVMMVYAHGLKINDVVNLERNDVDLESGILIIRNNMPKKSRRLKLSTVLIEPITAYLEKYEPIKYFFSGSGGDKKYSPRNIQLFFQKAISDAELDRNASLNTLRHSFAVHSLERGLDIHILKEILGHSNLQTTSHYVQFAEIKVEAISSPLDFMV
jgi:integrase/recombinase XerD